MKIERLQRFAERSPTLRRLLAPATAARRHFTGYHQREQVFGSLERLLAEDPVMRIASFDGTFSMDPRSAIFKALLSWGDYEPDLARCCRDYLDPERDAVDVGANVGLYTVLMARHLHTGRRVLAVEPTANALRHLYANLDRNGVPESVLVFEGVASDREGPCAIRTIEGREDYSTIGQMTHPHVAEAPHATLEVQAATLDTLVEQYALDPGFVKVDVEGAEAAVFRGAEQVLTRARPVVLSELSDYMLRQNGSSAAAVIALFERHDYTVIDPTAPARPVGRMRFGDILCIPRERLPARRP